MQVAILQPNYIPWRGYFDIIAKVDKFVFYDDAQYTKDDWRNRNRLLGPQGPFWLTIPIKTKGLLGQKINETMIADHSWQKKHWRSIEVNYAKAPYYFEYCEDIQKLYAQKYSSLVEVNCRFIQKISSLLGLKTEFIYSSQISYRGTRASEKVLSICQLLQGNVYVSGPAAKNYLNEESFAKSGIEIQFMDYSHYREYPQIVAGYSQENLSILDLLFNCGPESLDYLS